VAEVPKAENLGGPGLAFETWESTLSFLRQPMSTKPSSRASSPASSSRGFDKELAALEALAESVKAGHPLNAEAVEQLRETLAHRNNFLVSKAARLVADAGCPRSRF